MTSTVSVRLAIFTVLLLSSKISDKPRLVIQGAGSDDPNISQKLVEAIRLWPDDFARDELIDRLMISVQLGDETGDQTMF